MPKRIDSSSPPASTQESPVRSESTTGTLAQPRRLKRSSSGRSNKPRQRSWLHKLWLVAQIGLVLFIIVAAIGGYLVYEKALYYRARAEAFDLGKLNDLNLTSTFYDVNGEELGRIFVEDRIELKPEQIPETMRQAVMAAEDRRYYEHGAIDYWGILRALREDLSKHSHGVQGGSTIEQQLAKHLIGDFSRTLDRKFLEAFLAIRLEKNFTKDQIMNYYLNRIYFGKGYFGVGAAARGYFNEDAINLTVPQCALLAGIIRAPTSSSPRTDLGRAKLHRDITLKQMYDDGYIKSHEEYSRALNTPILIQPAKPNGLQSFVMAAAVKEMEQILAIEGTEEMPQGLTVHTNINLRLQRAIEEQMSLNLEQLTSSAAPAPVDQPTPITPLNPTLGPKIAVKAPLQDAAIVADAATGRVLAWVGGRDFSRNQFDHVSMARRENGALLQPLIDGLAFDRLNLTPASMINASFIDPKVTPTPADLALGNPLVDLNRRFLSIQDALALGNRPAATRIGLQLGAKPFQDWLRQAGAEQARVPEDEVGVFNPDPMTLGDVASLYQVLANDGVRRKLRIIRSIQSSDGQELYSDDRVDKKHSEDELLNKVDDEQLTLTLQNALRSGFGRTLTQDYGLKSDIAGMPGYSDNYRDAWFVGYTPTIVAGVWVGYDDSRPIGAKDLALRSAVPLWGNLMQQVETRVNTGGSFPVPNDFSKVEIDRYSGALRGMAGLAPAPGDIFVYLKKDQVDAAATQASSAPQQLQAPREWSDWLTTMFNDADETGLAPDQIMGGDDKRSNIIPALAEYKLPGLRGDILSQDGAVYATMGTEHNLVLKWPDASEAATDDDIVRWTRSRLDEVEKTIGVKMDISDADIASQFHTLRYQPLLVLEDITPAQVGMIQTAGLEAKGFGFQIAPRRSYPRGTELSHVLGYLSRDQQRNRGKYLSGDVAYDRYKGASGLESVFNKELIGKDGRFLISTNPEGYARSAAVVEPATYGNNIRLSIDSKIQAAVEQALTNSPHKMTAAVLLDVQTGDVVAMASHPTFDPNIFVPAIASDEWQLLNTDTTNPLLNRAIHAEYPPGSCFKTVTSVAAMNAGVFDPNWVVHCTGYFDVGSVHMVLKDEHGDITYKDALTYSYNTYFATLGLKVGRDILLDTARSLNLGSPTGIDLPNELPGMIPDTEFVRRVFHREFGEGDVANTSIGQGNVLVTPLQMADLMATYANNGTVYRPRLIQDVEDRSGTVIKSYPVETLRTVTFNQKYMPLLKQAMIAVTEKGTAKKAHRSDMQVAAKTGTAQVGSKNKRRQIAWLCGYFPADNPKYSFAVMVQGTFEDNHNDSLTGGLLGGEDAAPIVRDVLNTLYGKKGSTSDDDSDTHAASDREAAAADTNADTDDDDSATTPAKTQASAKTDSDEKPTKLSKPVHTPSASSKDPNSDNGQ